MKSLLLIMFVSSVLVFINYANAFECPDVVRVPHTGNIVNLNEVDILDNGSVECIYPYISSETHTQKTYTFNYTDVYYTGADNFIIASNGSLTCTTGKSKNPADCTFYNSNQYYVRQLQRCPDSITDTDGYIYDLELGIMTSIGDVGTTKCTYNYLSENGPVFEGLYFDSDDHYYQSLWNRHYQNANLNGRLVCLDSGSNPVITNPDHCEFYLAN